MSNPVFTYNGKPYSFNDVSLNFHKVRQQLPGVLGTVAVNYFKDSFRRQGWRDRALTHWAKRKDDKKKNKGRAILVKSGRLRNSIRVIMSTPARIEVGTSVPYAAAHNEGFQGTVNVRSHTREKYKKVKEQYTTRTGKVASKTSRMSTGNTYKVRSHTRQMNLPQRQFMGESEVLSMKIDQTVIRAIDAIF
jgi:phage gpG-like protein